MRKSRWSALALAAVTVATAGAAPVRAAEPAQAEASSAVAAVQDAYDGKAVYAGLVLGIGPVAGKFPELGWPAGGVSADRERFSAELIAAVEAEDPGFFAAFGQDMTSGDRVRIDRAFISAQNVTRTAVAERLGLKAQATSAERSAGLVTYQFAPMAGYVYEIMYVYKILNAVREYNVFEVEGLKGAGMSTDAPRLDRERLVDLIADRLSLSGGSR
jgi:SdpC family antimicrobial peptide